MRLRWSTSVSSVMQSTCGRFPLTRKRPCASLYSLWCSNCPFSIRSVSTKLPLAALSRTTKSPGLPEFCCTCCSASARVICPTYQSGRLLPPGCANVGLSNSSTLWSRSESCRSSVLACEISSEALFIWAHCWIASFWRRSFSALRERHTTNTMATTSTRRPMTPITARIPGESAAEELLEDGSGVVEKLPVVVVDVVVVVVVVVVGSLTWNWLERHSVVGLHGSAPKGLGSGSS